jgi:ADP-ribosyl-[dinitrogen reductase] hydrolase
MSDTTVTAGLAEKILRYRHLLPPLSTELSARMNDGGADASGWTPQRTAAPETPTWPALDPVAARDRAVGCLLGLAIGDAVGTTAEFKPRGGFPPLTDLTGGGPFKLAAGEWTDDTTMALCLGQSLHASGTLDLEDFMLRLQAWLEQGENTVPGKCFDIGATTRAAIERYAADGNPAAGSRDPMSAGNGSLVRLAPLAIFATRDPDTTETLAARQSRATHAALECVDACRLFASQLVDALTGADKEATLRQRVMALCPAALLISAGEYKHQQRDQIHSSGYVIHTLEAALWSVWQTDNFRDAVLTAANLGDDADSVAAVAGQLAGALYGAAAIPPEWLAKLAWRDRIEFLAHDLFEQGAPPE